MHTKLCILVIFDSICATRALQNLNYPKQRIHNKSYRLNILIPKYIFNKDYPVEPKTFGEKLRKARMDAELKIKDLPIWSE